MSRYGGTIIYTRLGLIMDHLIDVSKKHPSTFTRAQFAKVTGLKASSTGDKLRDMESYGLISRNDTGYTITATGLAILAGGTERKSAILTAINKVPLWVYLIKEIGMTPSTDAFNKTIKGIAQYSNIVPEILSNLWFAYNYDISCLTKTPPYSDWSQRVQKSNIKQLHIPEPSAKDNAPPKEVITVIPKHIVNSQIVEPTIQPELKKEPSPPSKGEPGSQKEENRYELTIRYRDHFMPVIDEESYRFAEHIMKKLRKKLGVESDD